jgi:hypothetical protein
MNRTDALNSIERMIEITHVTMSLLFVAICLGISFVLVNVVPPFGLNSNIFPEEAAPAVDCLVIKEFQDYFTPIQKETLAFVSSSIETRKVQPEVYVYVSDTTRDVLYATTTYQGIGDMGRNANAWMNKAKFILYMTDIQQSANEPLWTDVDRTYGELRSNVELYAENAGQCR